MRSHNIDKPPLFFLCCGDIVLLIFVIFQIDAHVGGVNDISFSTPNKQLCVITCGDDKTIKVWDAATGVKRHTFEGHEAPVYSVCPHYKENIQVSLISH